MDALSYADEVPLVWSGTGAVSMSVITHPSTDSCLLVLNTLHGGDHADDNVIIRIKTGGESTSAMFNC